MDYGDAKTWELIAWANQNHVAIEDLPKLAAKAYNVRCTQGVEAIIHGVMVILPPE